MTASTGPTAKPRVLLIGWEAASFRVLRKLAESGNLPAAAALLDSGRLSGLRSTAPRVSASLWSSLMTGCPPHSHGVLHSQETAADGPSVAPISSGARRLPTIARVLSDAGLRAHQIGGTATSPAEPLAGVWIGDRFASHGERAAVDTSGAPPWMDEGALQQDVAARFRSPGDVTVMSLSQFLPEQAMRSSGIDAAQGFFQCVIAETNTLFGAASLLVDDPGWDFFAVVFPVLGRLLQNKAVLAQAIDAAAWNQALSACYEQLDLILGHLSRQAGPDTLVMLVSADGTDGPFILLNDTAVAGGLAPTAHSRLIDVAPTICSVLCGTEPSWFEGESWAQPGESAESIRAWKRKEPDHTEAELDAFSTEPAPQESDPSTAHLVALGYTDPLWRKQLDACQTVVLETGRNRVASLLDSGLADQAVEELRTLSERFPDATSLRELSAELNARFGDVERAKEDVRVQTETGRESARLYLVRGILALRERRAQDAVDLLHIARGLKPALKGLHAAQGEALRRLGNFAAAEAVHVRGLDRAPQDPVLLDGMAACLLARGAAEKAAETALEALAMDPTAWRLHYRLAVALILLEQHDEAEAALHAALRLRPDCAAACYWLARLAESSGRSNEARQFRAQGLAILRGRGSALKPVGA